jgi:hypothetical protein
MDTLTINSELEHYVGDRLTTNNSEALRRLYLRAVARCGGPVLTDYLEQLGRYAAAYAAVSHMLKSPMRHIESPLFLSSLTLVVAGVIMMVSGEFSVVVAGGTSAGIVGMIHCGRRFIKLWLQYAIDEAVFRELAETLLNKTNEPGYPA